MPKKRKITVIISPSEGERKYGFVMPRWAFVLLVGLVIAGWAMVCYNILSAALWRGSKIRMLKAENIRLRKALVKLDSLEFEIRRLSAMKRILEQALLVSGERTKKTSTKKQKLEVAFRQKPSPFRNVGLPELADFLDSKDRLVAHIPSGLPVKGPVTAKFGEVGGIFKSPHTGVDIYAKDGTPVSATADGVVIEAGENRELGKFVVVDHLNGYETVYGHLSEIVVDAGDIVGKGDIIGYSGHTGMVRGPHVHYEVRYKGKPIDPLKL
ncbi:M23 family metallopeptidase [bacterium]|nr:M23 family metallopeptidase [bacterium]